MIEQEKNFQPSSGSEQIPGFAENVFISFADGVSINNIQQGEFPYHGPRPPTDFEISVLGGNELHQEKLIHIQASQIEHLAVSPVAEMGIKEVLEILEFTFITWDTEGNGAFVFKVNSLESSGRTLMTINSKQIYPRESVGMVTLGQWPNHYSFSFHIDTSVLSSSIQTNTLNENEESFSIWLKIPLRPSFQDPILVDFSDKDEKVSELQAEQVAIDFLGVNEEDLKNGLFRFIVK